MPAAPDERKVMSDSVANIFLSASWLRAPDGSLDRSLEEFCKRLIDGEPGWLEVEERGAMLPALPALETLLNAHIHNWAMQQNDKCWCLTLQRDMGPHEKIRYKVQLKDEVDFVANRKFGHEGPPHIPCTLLGGNIPPEVFTRIYDHVCGAYPRRHADPGVPVRAVSVVVVFPEMMFEAAHTLEQKLLKGLRILLKGFLKHHRLDLRAVNSAASSGEGDKQTVAIRLDLKQVEMDKRWGDHRLATRW